MGNMANASKGLASKTVGPDGHEIFKVFEFGRGEPLAQNGQIVSLVSIRQAKMHKRWEYLDSVAVVCNLQ